MKSTFGLAPRKNVLQQLPLCLPVAVAPFCTRARDQHALIPSGFVYPFTFRDQGMNRRQ